MEETEAFYFWPVKFKEHINCCKYIIYFTIVETCARASNKIETEREKKLFSASIVVQ